MAEDDNTGVGEPAGPAEDEALASALAAEHAAVWGYGVVGAALPVDAQEPATASENAHRDARDGLVALLSERGVDPVGAEAGYELPFPVLSAIDAAALAATLEDGVAAAWVRVVDAAAGADLRGRAVEALSSAEVRAVGWRIRAEQTPVTRALPGLPQA
jgi:hypothetical protein